MVRQSTGSLTNAVPTGGNCVPTVANAPLTPRNPVGTISRMPRNPCSPGSLTPHTGRLRRLLCAVPDPVSVTVTRADTLLRGVTWNRR